MFYLSDKRNNNENDFFCEFWGINTGINLRPGIDKRSVSLGLEFKAFHKEAASRILSKRKAPLNKQASIRMIEVDLGDSGSGEPVDQVRALDHDIRYPKSNEFDNSLGWSLEKPQDSNYSGILLSADAPTIDSVAEKFPENDFIIDSFDLDSKHAWRRMF